MPVKGILFDLYGTLIDIETDESLEEIYRGIAHFLTYHGVYLHRWELRDRYYAIMKRQKTVRGEKYPEIDVEEIWNEFLDQEGLSSNPSRRELARTLAQLYRGISCKRLQLYPKIKEVLDELRGRYRTGLISDSQPCFAVPEIRAVGLDGYFDPVIISANYGFRKPDSRLFGEALDRMKLTPPDVIYVGNDMYRDIYGATLVGIKTIFVDSNQGIKSYQDVAPNYVAGRFDEVLKGIEALS